MALTHKAFLLDAKAFLQKIHPLLNRVEEGSIQPLYQAALEVIDQTNPEDWILADIGSRLLDIRKVKRKEGKSIDFDMEQLENGSGIPPSDIGYWILLIFSCYLKKCNGIGYNYSILEWCLEKIGCSSSWKDLLFHGAPLSSLVIDNTSYKQNMKNKMGQYVYWMRPSHTKGSGYWLSQEQIGKLYSYLLSIEKEISNFDYQLFGTHWGPIPITIPDGQYEYYEILQTAYKQAILMLGTAKLSSSDLYMVLSYT